MAEYKQYKLTDDHGNPYQYVEVDSYGGVAFKRQDGDWDIPLELEDHEIETLKVIAKQREMSLNDLMIEIVMEKVRSVAQE